MRTTKKRKPGHVYLATGPHGHKIGSTGNLTQRQWELRAQHGPTSTVVWSLYIDPDCLAVELGLHQKFTAKRVRGEWFLLDEADVQWIKSLSESDAAEVAALWKPTRTPPGTVVRKSPVPRTPKKSVKRIDIVGKKFARWTVVSYAGTHPTNPKTGSMWLCRCDCGTERVMARQYFAYGKTTSCGCYRKEQATSHGLTDTPEYSVWRAIRYRCYDPSYEHYDRYGERGITVCERWIESFDNFLADMGKRPDSTYSLERKNNNGPYSPDNCEWATKTTQVRNRECTVSVTYNGETKTLAEWAEQLGMKLQSLRTRLYQYGWAVERAFTTTIRPHGRK